MAFQTPIMIIIIGFIA